MTDSLLLDTVRFVEIVLTILVIAILVYRVVVYRDDIPRPHLLFHLGLTFIMISAIWDIYHHLSEHDEFSWKKLPYFIGLVMIYIYILEPRRSFEKRLNQMHHDPEEEEST